MEKNDKKKIQYVVLADKNDKVIGKMEKQEAHLNGGHLHRAISIQIFNSKGELLIQKRHPKKYHCGGMWSNSVCSHPRPGESYEDAAKRRLKEELGIETDLKKEFEFIYTAGFKNDLSEKEYDWTFSGVYDGEVFPDPKEISEIKWISPKELKQDIKENPNKYTEWFKAILDRLDVEESKKVLKT